MLLAFIYKNRSSSSSSKVQAFFKNRSSIHLPFIFPNLIINPGIDISAFSVGSVRNVR